MSSYKYFGRSAPLHECRVIGKVNYWILYLMHYHQRSVTHALYVASTSYTTPSFSVTSRVQRTKTLKLACDFLMHPTTQWHRIQTWWAAIIKLHTCGMYMHRNYCMLVSTVGNFWARLLSVRREYRRSEWYHHRHQVKSTQDTKITY